MGQELECKARWGRVSSTGKALLESDHVLFRGSFRAKVILTDVTSVEAKDGVLKLVTPEGPLALELGAYAEKWARKILHPPSRLDKLGVKPGIVAALVGGFDADFLAELKEAGTALDAQPPYDLVFLSASDRAGTDRVREIMGTLKPAGAVWIVYPKGVKTITELQVLEAGRAAGLKDVKVARFSATHTSLKFVIPKSAR